MSYKLSFHTKALKEWHGLNPTIQSQFKKKLAEHLNNPKVPKDKISGYTKLYKIKLRTLGYRLVYEVKDKTMRLFVITLGKRANNEIYTLLKKRATVNNK